MPDVTHGFELVREQDVPEVNSTVRVYRHVKTGAELLSFLNDDENKVFSVSFATPPPDSSGIAHILEHAVLNGSRKYPTKEPFVELLKGSLATFVNAMTFPDKTMYPVASQNEQDFYNLVDVYLDAVFFPRISPEVMMQEGWHYELDAPDDTLRYKGVVFNEMKGAYSSADEMLYTYSQTALYPDNAYAHDSGGDPRDIPTLTYENFRNFHDTYYHPSNARIIFYGNDDPERRLKALDEYLSEFDAIDVDAQIALQPKFDAPRVARQPYDSGDSDDPKYMVTVSWLLPEPDNVELMLGFDILDHILLGTQAAPLKKALLESGLGENTAGYGFEEAMRQMNFSTGLKGVAEADADKIEPLILETLQKLADDGIDKGQVEASMNTVEFQLREFNTGGYPRGLLIAIRAMSTWLYGGDPVAPLAFTDALENVKAQLEAREPYFENLIRAYLLDNTHRSMIIMYPDDTFGQQIEESEKSRLQDVQANLSDDAVQQIIADTQRLREIQQTPDAPEDLAKLPTLTLDDLERETRTIPTDHLSVADIPTLYHDLPTNGIVYLDLTFDLRVLPQEYLPYLSIFNRALLQMGTSQEDYVALTQRIGRKTGGISPSLIVSQKHKSDDAVTRLALRGKATVEYTSDLLTIMRDVMTDASFLDRDRFRQIVLSSKAGIESALAPAGHAFANKRLGAHLSLAGWIGEQTGGISYLFFLRDLAQRIETDWDSVRATLDAMRQHIFNQGNLLVNVTLDSDDWVTVQPQLRDFIASLPDETYPLQVWTPKLIANNEGLSIPAQVNYVAKGANLYRLGYNHHGSVHVISKFVNTTYLWNSIRVQGGAYGGGMGFNLHSGSLSYFSYRDPNLLETINVFDGTADFLMNLDLPQEELTKSIIGTIGDIDSYQLPDAKGYSALMRHLLDYSDATRQAVREQVLSTTAADFRAFGETLKQVAAEGLVAVVGASANLNAVNAAHPDMLTITKVL
jgi:presequence protease